MRGGDGVGLTGYDGFVEATRSTPFVPDGLSVWEMGVGGEPEKKAQSDYRTRTDKPNGVDRATTTFVFVTPRRWEKKKDWEQRRRDENIWRDVRVLDADDIEQALRSLQRSKFGCRSCSAWTRLVRPRSRTGGTDSPGDSGRH